MDNFIVLDTMLPGHCPLPPFLGNLPCACRALLIIAWGATGIKWGSWIPTNTYSAWVTKTEPYLQRVSCQ